jgi:hypothetical protein
MLLFPIRQRIEVAKKHRRPVKLWRRFGGAAAILGVSQLYLCDETLGVIRRDGPRNARRGIDVLLQQRSRLARRFGVDRALLPSAPHGLGEDIYQDKYRAVIDELQKTFFESISVSGRGELGDFKPMK